jgi:hypothetical protein
LRALPTTRGLLEALTAWGVLPQGGDGFGRRQR